MIDKTNILPVLCIISDLDGVFCGSLSVFHSVLYCRNVLCAFNNCVHSLLTRQSLSMSLEKRLFIDIENKITYDNI